MNEKAFNGAPFWLGSCYKSIISSFQSVINNEVLEAQRKKQAELISQLKGQLEELESYAYESGEAIVPSNLLLERQRIVMGEFVMYTCVCMCVLEAKVMKVSLL